MSLMTSVWGVLQDEGLSVVIVAARRNSTDSPFPFMSVGQTHHPICVGRCDSQRDASGSQADGLHRAGSAAGGD